MTEERWSDRMQAAPTCGLCHRPGFGVKARLVRLRDDTAPGGSRYESMRRCTDAEACRSYLQLHGKPWPVLEEAPTIELPGFGA